MRKEKKALRVDEETEENKNMRTRCGKTGEMNEETKSKISD